MRLRWSDGCLVMDGDGATGSIDKPAAEARAEVVFMDLLAAFIAQGRDASPNRSNAFAPTVFAKHPTAQSKGVGKDALEAAMDRLLDAGRLRVEPIGPPSKRTKKLVFVERKVEP